MRLARRRFLRASPREPPIKPVPMMVTCLKLMGISVVISNVVGDLQFVGRCRSLAAPG
jgi:hypothetical protein